MSLTTSVPVSNFLKSTGLADLKTNLGSAASTGISNPEYNVNQNLTILSFGGYSHDVYNITEITSSQFSSSSATDLSIGNAVTTIGSNAFSYCTAITGSLIIPDSVTSIGSSAFQGCTGFNGTLNIGKSINLIDTFAFNNCSNLTGVNIFALTAPTIGSSAFYGMTAVSPTEIHVPTAATGYATGYDGLTVVYDL